VLSEQPRPGSKSFFDTIPVVAMKARKRAELSKLGPDQSPRKTSDGIQSVARALAILELFSERQSSLSISQIAELSSLNRATAYRFCRTLLGLGYLEDAGHRTYRPGLKAVSLALGALSSRELPDLALPYLRRLQEATGETVNMALRDGPDVVLVARLLSHHVLNLRLYVGSRIPAYASSLGRAILAFLPEDELNQVLDKTNWKPLTEHTIVQRERLMKELARARQRGYSINEEETVVGVSGVGAPVFAASDRPIASINIAIAHSISHDELENKLAPQVVSTARSISELVAGVAPQHH
jgi:IclR family pca regulon transcriptional regulator